MCWSPCARGQYSVPLIFLSSHMSCVALSFDRSLYAQLQTSELLCCSSSVDSELETGMRDLLPTTGWEEGETPQIPEKNS